MSTDPNKIAQLEQAIAQKYGAEAVDNPHKFWTPDKEKNYIEQSKNEQRKLAKLSESRDKVEQDGFLINKKLLIKDHNRTCPICDKYSFHFRDDMYMSKFGACFKCYVQWIEGRVERWKKGWRPDKE